ncbi:hypothetical protein L596_013291 [Steinernema carpocapsae]|uniref:Uncharacterized protein n=1 Tax=Steinernema carpocapsae TaxID=34508 RepID=A0A4U5NZP6_STECR|nr:hypothetical protein L596_013291 [Steinernema carpocapsae]
MVRNGFRAIWRSSNEVKKRILQVVERYRRDYPAQTTIGYDENGAIWPFIKFFVFIALWGRVQLEILSRSYKKLHNRKEKRQF